MSQPMKQSILVVDDSPANLQLLVGMLTEQSYRVRSAPSGQRALATIHKELPNLILLDILMPDLDGYEVCRHLKADPHTRDVPVIFISALDELFDKMTAFAVGGVDYITKPFQAAEVLARVQTHLTLAEMRQTLQQQNQQLQEQNQELDAFAHTVAHDLKTPLAKILASFSLIQEHAPQLDQELQSLFQIGVTASRKMNTIIDELLLLASARTKTVPLAPINMAEVVEQALHRLSHLLEEYRAEVIMPEAWPLALGYAPWIEEIWANYLSNGLKYGGRPPRLELGATGQSDGMARFWVRDNGPGLTPPAQAALFTEFTRLDRSEAEGHGLGLSIVRRIITKLGGQAGVESAPGEGSRFYFTLPIATTVIGK